MVSRFSGVVMPLGHPSRVDRAVSAVSEPEVESEDSGAGDSGSAPEGEAEVVDLTKLEDDDTDEDSGSLEASSE